MMIKSRRHLHVGVLSQLTYHPYSLSNTIPNTYHIIPQYFPAIVAVISLHLSPLATIMTTCYLPLYVQSPSLSTYPQYLTSSRSRPNFVKARNNPDFRCLWLPKIMNIISNSCFKKISWWSSRDDISMLGYYYSSQIIHIHYQIWFQIPTILYHNTFELSLLWLHFIYHHWQQ